MIAGVFAVGNVLFVVFYAEWIAYSVHWIIRWINVSMFGVQMVSRLYVCPPAAFNKVASIGGMLKAVGFLSGSSLGPILFTADDRLPFVVMAALNVLLMIVVATVYVYRLRILSAMEFDDDIKGQYLLMERAANDPDKSPENKAAMKRQITMTQDMLRSPTSLIDLAFATSS